MASQENLSSPSTDARHICHINVVCEENETEARPTSLSRSATLEFDSISDHDHTQSTIKADDFNTSSGDNKVMFEDDQGFDAIPVHKLRPNVAVTVRDGMKRYGSGPPILSKYSMTVQKGTIYSLLGSSGCGKTTLLTCLLGLRHLNAGQILIFGAQPGTKESGIPGKRVGYMPQDTALYHDFTIAEILRYFGTLYGMANSEISKSRDFLIGFLDLPEASRRIGTLSGGQKRRMSLAIALVHTPELLILDEPTVGVDPLLRECIWNHLCKLVSSQSTTVIITTHYIEEARQSNTIGLMRGGRLLAEKSPGALLQEHNTNILEDIVMKLCRNDTIGNFQEDVVANYDRAKELQETELEKYEEPSHAVRKRSSQNNPSGNQRTSMAVQEDEVEDLMSFKNVTTRIRALIQKNFIVMTRNLVLLLFILLIPAMQVCTTCLAIGADPKPLRIGIVNSESNLTEACLAPRIYSGGCDVENLSCAFLSKLPQDTIFLRSYTTEEDARMAVQLGKIWGFMSFPEGYSDNVYARSSSGNIVDNDTLDGSQIRIQMDMTNKHIAGTLKRLFYDGYRDFVKELLIDCGFHPEVGESPLHFETPIFGTDDTDFKQFGAPGVLLGIMFFFPLCSSGISYIWDKKQGTLERARVAGVQSFEIIIAFFMSEISIIIIQAIISFMIIILVFAIEIKGSIFLAFSIAILTGISGISLGFLIASFCNEEIEAIMLALAAFFPNFLLGGMLWPIEGMPVFIQYFSYILPCTLAGESIRSIVSRGWGFTHDNVWPGFVTLVVWIIFYSVLTNFMHRYKAKRT